jgi:hypothetical protein
MRVRIWIRSRNRWVLAQGRFKSATSSVWPRSHYTDFPPEPTPGSLFETASTRLQRSPVITRGWNFTIFPSLYLG